MVYVTILKNKNGKNEVSVEQFYAGESERFKLEKSSIVNLKDRVFLKRKSPDAKKENFQQMEENGLLQFKDNNIPVLNEDGYATRKFVVDYLESVGAVGSENVLTLMHYSILDLSKPINYGEFSYLIQKIFYSQSSFPKIEPTNEFKISVIKQGDEILTDLLEYKQGTEYTEYWVEVSKGGRAIPYPIFATKQRLFQDKNIIGEVPRKIVIDTINNLLKKGLKKHE